MKKFIRLNDVKLITGLSKSSIYAMMNSGEFPKNVSLGARAVAWIDTEVSEWMERRVSASRAAAYA